MLDCFFVYCLTSSCMVLHVDFYHEIFVVILPILGIIIQMTPMLSYLKGIFSTLLRIGFWYLLYRLLLFPMYYGSNYYLTVVVLLAVVLLFLIYIILLLIYEMYDSILLGYLLMNMFVCLSMRFWIVWLFFYLVFFISYFLYPLILCLLF